MSGKSHNVIPYANLDTIFLFYNQTLHLHMCGNYFIITHR